MAHFAKIQDGLVTQVIVADKEFVDTLPNIDNGVWIQTSYNTIGGVHQNGGMPLRKNFAGIGFHYDEVNDAFYPPQPYPSWTLNEDTYLWDAPKPQPNDGKFYQWDEETLSWIEDVEV